MNVNLSRVIKAAVAKAAWLPLAAAALLGGASVPAARAQTAPPPPPGATEAPSAVNPFPNPLADAQNRGRSGFDLYWGVADGNFLWNQTPLARIPDQNDNALVGLSGWTWPYAIDTNTADGVAYGRYVNLYNLPLSTYQNPGVVQDDQPQQTGATPPATTPALPAAGTSYTTGAGVWDAVGAAPLPGGLVTGPSLNPLGGSYHRTVAVQRPAGSAFNYFLTNNSYYGAANAGKRNNLFSWFPSIPGAGGQMVRYAIRVVLPDITDSDPNENRVSDARYLVHYYVRTPGGGLVSRYKVCFVGQDSDAAAGSKYLSETQGGTPAYFPFFTENTYNPTDPGFVAVPDGREFVALDNTTTDDLNNGTEYVLADGLAFEQRVAVVHAPPTVTPFGGGRKVDTATAPVQQPAAGPNYSVGFTPAQTAAGHAPSELLVTGTGLSAAGAATAPQGLIMPNSSFAFANSDPRDPDYAAGGALAGKYDPNNPTVLFQGPEAFARPKILASQYGAPYGTATGPGVGTYDPVPQPALPAGLVATGAQLTATQNVLPVPPLGPVPAGDSGGTRLQYNPLFPPVGYNNLAPDAAAAPFAQQIALVSANNFEVYRPDMGDGAAPTYDLLAGANRPVPLYSHLQVIVARTVYVPDPETGVPANRVDGTRAIEVGEVLGLDWQTGAVLWRFPDRTYLPDVEAALVAQGAKIAFAHGYPEPNGGGIAPQSSLRNAFIGFQTVTSPTGVAVNAYPLYQVPGIVAYDLNGDGRIEDNEVFIGPTPNTASGGLYAGVTVAGRIPVQGRVQIPLYNQDQSIPGGNDGSPIVGVADAPAGRYADTAGNAVPVTTAFVASQNGVVYAIDAHGNNDNRYREAVYDNNAADPEYDPTNPDPNADPQSGLPRHNPAGPKRFGTFHPGTTNVFWTFSTLSAPRLQGQRLTAGGAPQFETLLQYHRRVKGEVPATLGFGSSAPVIAYRKDENDPSPAIVPEGLNAGAGTDEPRLFVGNQNGNLYAMDAAALGGSATTLLPFHKGDQPSAVTTDGTSAAHRTDLRWWFETEAQSASGGGAINGAPAVSLNRLVANVQSGGTSAASGSAEKGVYFSSAAGRVYCVDWTGPVRADDAGHFFGTDGRSWDGTAGTVTTPFPPNGEKGAATFNDNYRFHNQFSANPLGRQDLTEGTIRPRWVYPSQYTDINGDGKVNAGDNYNAPDASTNGASTGRPVRDTALAPIGGAVSLMDFVWTKPGTTTSVVKHYVAVAANDNVNGTDTAPVTGHVYLLDQAGDRGAFLTNPMISSGSLKLAYSSPIDQFALKTQAVGQAAPAWTYRFQYGSYDAAGNLIIQGTNNGTAGSPTANGGYPSVNHPTPVDAVTGLPRNLFPDDVNLAQPSRRVVPTLFFGGVGRIWAVDIDLATGVFTRWRPNGAPQPVPLPLDAGGVQAGVVPTDPESAAYVLPWHNPDLVSSPVGNLYAQQVLARTVPLPSTDGSSVDGSLTIAGGPLQTRDSNLNLAPAPANLPMVPPHPTNDPPALEPPGYGRDATQTAPAFAGRLDPTGRYVNQEIDDPLATTRGSHYTFATDANTPDNVHDVSFQFPTLFLTTAGSSSASSAISGGGLYEVSTNLDGEDTTTLSSAALGTQTAALGWAFSTDLLRFNEAGHVYQLSVTGPGGTGSGVAVMTAAYFPGLDPNFQTNKTGTYPAGDPTAATFPLYPDYEPGIEANDPTTGAFNATRNTDPNRSGGVLHPRGYFPGDTAAGLAADYATGAAGLPLDANGLFFEKKSALRDVTGDSAFPYSDLRWLWGGPNTTPTNDDGQIALPGWSGFLAGNAASAGPPTGIPNGLPDGIRPRSVTVNAIVQNGNNDDVNPTAGNAIWIFSGGPDGALYAYTPALPRRFGGPGGSGLAGGTIVSTNPSSYLSPQPKFDIFPGTYANALDGNTRPDRGQSIAATSHNYFEWGETIYIVAWDFAVGTPQYAPGQQPAFLANPPAELSIQIVDSTGRPLKTLTATRGTGPDRILPGSYPYNPSYFPGSNPQDATNAGVTTGAPLGVAVFRYDLNGSTQQTPGTVLKVHMAANDMNSAQVNPYTGGRTLLGRPAGGALDAEILANNDIPFMIANPLAVQAFVPDTQGRPATIGVDSATYTTDSIGPFEMNGSASKDKVAANTTQGTPDKRSVYYSQALANGNLIQRIDLSPYGSGGITTRNRNVQQKLTSTGASGGTPDNDYYIPVVVDAGFGSHGGSATTDATTASGIARYLHVVNRSVLRTGLPKVRAQVMGDLLWRSWPGTVPNEDATDGGTISGGPLDGTPSQPGGANPRKTPVSGTNYAMRADGVVNFLPWEQPVTETQPWKSATAGSALATGGNSSQDYPDILSRNGGVPSVTAASGVGGDPTKGAVTLQPAGDPTAVVNANLNNANSGLTLEQNPVLTGANTLLGMTLNVGVPKYQPANLVAMHSLTSTYVAPSALTDPLGGVTTTAGAPVQLPYTGAADTTQTAHLLQANGANTIAPFGYTTQVRIYVDTNSNGAYDAGEAYRDVEVWMGVPVDMNLASVESPVEISGPNGALAMGFGLQNGFLGYNLANNDFRQGFLPTPLADPNFFAVTSTTPNGAAYSPFFKKFTIQNRGNVNLWNLRASQRASNTLDASSGYSYYELRSTAVDPVQGIQAAGMDPNLGVMPQVVTSLDSNLDNAWDTLTNPGSAYNPFSLDANTYTTYYQGFGGKHPLHKARVGSNTDTILSIPDVPSAVDLGNVTAGGASQPITPQVPFISVAVPIGTPSGIYGPPDTAPADFYVFEDHDTTSQYKAAPLPNGTGPAVAAGPLYNGTDLLYPGKGVSVLPATGTGIFRPRALPPSGTSVPASDYLPHTDPGMRLRVTVGEGALTGQIVDPALPSNNPAVTNGVLPFVDTEPLIDASSAASGPRAAAALSPAAYRDATGSLHLFFARNSNATNANGTAQPGSPFNLFVSDLLWDTTTGQWTAKTAATGPVQGNYAAGGGPTGQWFTAPQQVGVTGQPAGSSDTSPYVLQDFGSAGAPATLFFLNTVPVAGGQGVRTIYYAPLTTSGGTTAVGAAQPWLQNADPSLQRYAPRAVFDAASGTDLLFFFGGVSSKWALYYSPRGAAAGLPNDATPNAATTQSEFPLSLPLSITTASDPVPVVRQIVPVGGTAAQTFVDVYYTGVARTDAAPNLYMTRYQLVPTGTTPAFGAAARLAPVPLARHTGERLAATPGSPVYRSRDIAWVRDARDAANLPVLYLNGSATPAVNAAYWRYDDATNLLVQKIAFGGQAVYVYVDTSAGTVRFRGAPAALAAIQSVTADYTPQTARVTASGVANTGAFGFFDDRVLPDTPTEQQTVQQNATPTNYILARPNPMVAGRAWLFWRQAASGATPATLQYVTRRVGVDLKSVPVGNGGMSASTTQSESIGLSPANAAGVQAPLVTVAIDGAATTNYEVDTANGRVYVDPTAEGHRITVSYTVVNATGGNPATRTCTTTIGQVEDLDPTKPSQQYNGKAVGLQRSVNEGQPYAFLDRYDGRGLSRAGTAGAPNPLFDPTLQPGKVWLFWTSPRSRSGALRDATTGAPLPPVNGYDAYWQTLAPWFSYDAFRPVLKVVP